MDFYGSDFELTPVKLDLLVLMELVFNLGALGHDDMLNVPEKSVRKRLFILACLPKHDTLRFLLDVHHDT